MVWLLSLVLVAAAAAWLHLDLKKRVAPKVSLGVSIGLAVVTWLLGLSIASSFLTGTYANLLGAGASLLVSAGIARPVSQRLRKRLGA